METMVDPAMPAAGRATTILVVDDEPFIRRFVMRAVERDGIAVVEAQDGRVALDAFRADPGRFSALVCDLTLPDIRGEEVVRTVRAERPDLPVIVMTGWDPATAAASLGPVDGCQLLQKPFLTNDLRDALGRALALVG